MNITDDFPVGTELVIKVVQYENDCTDCIFFATEDCDKIKCTSLYRKDRKTITFKLVEVKEP